MGCSYTNQTNTQQNNSADFHVRIERWNEYSGIDWHDSHGKHWNSLTLTNNTVCALNAKIYYSAATESNRAPQTERCVCSGSHFIKANYYIIWTDGKICHYTQRAYAITIPNTIAVAGRSIICKSHTYAYRTDTLNCRVSNLMDFHVYAQCTLSICPFTPIKIPSGADGIVAFIQCHFVLWNEKKKKKEK